MLETVLKAGHEAGFATVEAFAEKVVRQETEGGDGPLSLHEARGDRLAALTALLSCQASLTELHGEAARRPTQQVLATRRRRWGEPLWQELLEKYRAQFA